MRIYLERILGLDYYQNWFTRLYRNLFWSPQLHSILWMRIKDTVFMYQYLFTNRHRLWQESQVTWKEEMTKHLADFMKN